MRVDEVMAYGGNTIDASETIREAAEQLRALVVRALPVVSDGRLVGLLTDRDLAVRAVAQGLDPRKTHVYDVMTRAPFTVDGDEPIEMAARMMEAQGVRRLVVVDDGQRPVGILSVEDLALFPDTAALAIALLRRLYGARSVELDGSIP